MSDPGAYGDRHAEVYDRIYGAADPAAAVAVLAEAGRDGGLLELGVGTGRLARPLAALGLRVDGIDGSARMLRRMQALPGGELVGGVRADLAGFDLPYHRYGAAVCAVSTLAMLTPAEQARCIRAAAGHLRPGGLLFIELFRFDPARFDAEGRREEVRRAGPDGHVVRSRHEPGTRSIAITHVLDGAEFPVRLHYRSLSELDAMAAAAGLVPVDRWADWTRAPMTADSRDPVSVYRRPEEWLPDLDSNQEPAG